MELIHKLVIEDRPLGSLFEPGASSSQATGETTLITIGDRPELVALSLGERVNTTFEDWHGDDEIGSIDEWRLYYPVACPPPSVVVHHGETRYDIYKLLRNTLGADTLRNAIGETHTLFDNLSHHMNELKTVINTRPLQLSERELTRYLFLLTTLETVFDNSTRVFCYVLPQDDGRSATTTTTLQQQCRTLIYSDQLRFEHLHVLLALLVHYQHATNSKLGIRRQIELWQKCIDTLREIECLANGIGNGDKMRYTHTTTSLSSSPTSTTTANSGVTVTNVTWQQIVERCLGGTAGIRARIHLCQARRCELILADQRARNIVTHDRELLGAVVDNYERAAALYVNDRRSKFAYTMRFMHHFWVCRANLQIAQQQCAEDNGNVSEALQRVAFITRQHRKFLVDRVGPFKLAQAVRETYNPIITATQDLYKRLHTELRNVVDIDDTREYLAASFPPYEYGGAKESTLSQALQRAGAELLADTTLHLSSLCAILVGGGKHHITAPDTTARSQPPFRLPSMLRDAVEGDIDAAASTGILIERCEWLRWLRWGIEEGQFIFPDEYRETFARVLDEAEKRLAALHR